MRYYPLYLSLGGCRCVVIAGGPVAEGKIEPLLEAEAQVTVISPQLTPALKRLADENSVTRLPRREPTFAGQRNHGGLMSILFIKLVHTVIFIMLSASALFVLSSGVADHISVWTWIALLAILSQGIVLALSGWKCPLTTMAERQGAPSGSVTDIFLPKWFADRVFPTCGFTYLVACVVVIARWIMR